MMNLLRNAAKWIFARLAEENYEQVAPKLYGSVGKPKPKPLASSALQK